MSPAVLADEVSQIRSETHIGHGGFVVAPFVDWESLEENESLSMKDIILQSLQEARQLWERESAL